MGDSTLILDRISKLYSKRIELSLDRVFALLNKLDNPHERMPAVIHVAGTNGKGSIIAFMLAMLEARGRRVHSYTSPHLLSFHERIRLADGAGRSAPISEAQLVEALESVERVNAGQPITFFEFTTAVAFKVFAEHPSDVVLLEVGLGGRFDATNVVAQPRATVISPISLDHVDRLGETLGEIAFEKAGILKRNVTCIVGPQEEAALDVIEARSEAVGAPLIVAGRAFDAYEQAGRMVFQGEELLLDLPLPALVGRHQIVNAGIAIAALLAVPEFDVNETAIERGLLEVVWPGRLQRLRSDTIARLAGAQSDVWLDGGHNPAGGAALAQALADLDERVPKPVYLVVAMALHKNVQGFLVQFKDIARLAIAVSPDGYEAPLIPAEGIVEAAKTVGMRALAQPNLRAALAAIEAIDQGPKRIIICGSLYLAGEALAIDSAAT